MSGSSFPLLRSHHLANTSLAQTNKRRRRRKNNNREISLEFTLLPKTAKEGLKRYRKVMSVLYALGASLHVPDLIGIGPLCSLNAVHSFEDLPTIAKVVTGVWAIGGPISSFTANANMKVSDILVCAIASVEIIVGVDFSDEVNGVEIPVPILYAQAVNIASAILLRLWERSEEEEEEEEEEREL